MAVAVCYPLHALQAIKFRIKWDDKKNENRVIYSYILTHPGDHSANFACECNFFFQLMKMYVCDLCLRIKVFFLVLGLNADCGKQGNDGINH